jgi:hypothetical protein
MLYLNTSMKTMKRKEVVMETEKRDYSADARRRMAASGQAMEDGSFPIANRTDLSNAIQSVGRAGDYNKAKRHIMRRAKELGAEDMLPEDWRANKFWGSAFVGPLNPKI